MNHMDKIDSSFLNSQIKSLFDILGHHGFAQPPGQDVAGGIIRIPELIDSRCWIVELILSRNNRVGGDFCFCFSCRQSPLLDIFCTTHRRCCGTRS